MPLSCVFIVAMEIQVHANMIMAYLFTRFGDTGDGLESEASTYSLPPPDFPVSTIAEERAEIGAHGGQRITTRANNYDNDERSSRSSPSSGGGNDSRDYFNSYSGEPSLEFNVHSGHTLQDDSKVRRSAPPATKPNYMGGTSANKSKRFSTISPAAVMSSPGDKVAGIRAQRMSGGQQVNGGKNDSELNTMRIGKPVF